MCHRSSSINANRSKSNDDISVIHPPLTLDLMTYTNLNVLLWQPVPPANSVPWHNQTTINPNTLSSEYPVFKPHVKFLLRFQFSHLALTRPSPALTVFKPLVHNSISIPIPIPTRITDADYRSLTRRLK